MPIIKVKCKTPNCNATVSSDTDKWRTDKKIITIICPKCKQPIDQCANPNFVEKEKTEIIPDLSDRDHGSIKLDFAGWLIDKNSGKYYSLNLSKQTIGRKSSTQKSDIPIETNDITISGAHCIVEAKQLANRKIECTILDNSSKNGTGLNNKNLQAGEIWFLEDKDEINLGKSDLIFISSLTAENEPDLLKWIQNNP